MSKKHYIIPIFVPHEGCPHNCVFCNQDSITGSQDVINENYIKDTIDQYLKTIDGRNAIVEVSFFGGTFTAIDIEKQKSFLTIAKQYKDDNRIQKIRLSTRPDYIDENILNTLKEYGVDIIELGVQSMDDEVLKKSGRGHCSNDVIRASELIREYDFVLGHQVMLGLPGDNEEKDIKTVKALIDLRPNIFRIYPAVVIKDTPMENMFAKGWYIPYTLEMAVRVAKQIYCLLNYNEINVIRMGLQTTENINIGKDIIAGPFHPAFRELVEGSLLCDMIYEFVKAKTGNVEIKINSRDISKLYANKKYFFIDMKKQLNTINISVKLEDMTEKGTIEIIHDEQCEKMSIKDYMNKKAKEGKKNNS